MMKLEGHSRARRETARRRKSECKINLSRSGVASMTASSCFLPELTFCKSLHSTSLINVSPLSN